MSVSLKYLLRPFVAVAVFLVMACKPGVPSELIQPGELEDILYDYHVADGMAYVEGNYSELAFRRKAYREAVLRKHGVTEAELDSSLVYYYRHTELLHDVYKELSKRLNNDAIALGSTANELSQFGSVTSQGDTATVWRSDHSLILMPQPPYNNVCFDIKADTAYHEGDKIILSFYNQYIFQEGVRDGVALLAVTFKNDSTASQTLYLSSNNQYSMSIDDTDRKGIKSVKGFVYLGRGNSGTTSQTMKIMCISHMKLMRMHNKPQNEDDDESLPDNDPTTIPRPAPDHQLGVNGRPMVDDTSPDSPQSDDDIPQKQERKMPGNDPMGRRPAP